MAIYNGVELYYRGRKVYVTLRYGDFQDLQVVGGKPLSVTGKDERRIMALIARKPETRSALTWYLGVGT